MGTQRFKVGEKRLMNKRYVGHVIQLNQEANLLDLDWFLNQMKQDLVSERPGWLVTQEIGPHPIEPQGKCFVASKNYIGRSGPAQVGLYAAAIDYGYRRSPDGVLFHDTNFDVNFLDSGKTWTNFSAEQAVAEALQTLCESLTAAYVEPPQTFWSRVTGQWVCGRTLYVCPDSKN
jgi:hypothetical protein